MLHVFPDQRLHYFQFTYSCYSKHSIKKRLRQSFMNKTKIKYFDLFDV